MKNIKILIILQLLKNHVQIFLLNFIRDMFHTRTCVELQKVLLTFSHVFTTTKRLGLHYSDYNKNS